MGNGNGEANAHDQMAKQLVEDTVTIASETITGENPNTGRAVQLVEEALTLAVQESTLADQARSSGTEIS